MAAPQAALREIAAFAGLPPSGLGFLGGDNGSQWANLGVAHTVSGNRMRFATGRVEIRRNDTWRPALARRTRVRVSMLTIPWLARYGYLRAAAPAPLGSPARPVACRSPAGVRRRS